MIQDGDSHGDPPFMLEEGWEPLLNGRDLAGWTSCEPGAKNEWDTTRFIRYERYLGPTQLNGRAAPSGVMLNGTGRTANLCTERKFGDVEIYLEFMLAKGSNSGVLPAGSLRDADLRQLGRDQPDGNLRPRGDSITAG